MSRYIKAMNLSRDFFKDVGAKAATKKCMNFSSDNYTRYSLRRCIWDANGLVMPAFTNFRDIGAHLDLTRSNNGSALTARMNKAVKMTKRLRWLPISVGRKSTLRWPIFCQLPSMELRRHG